MLPDSDDLDAPTPPPERIAIHPIPTVVAALLVIFLDQLTKGWAVANLADAPCSSAPDACIDVFWTLRFHYVGNPGASFSSFTSGGPVLGVIALLMTAFLIYQGSRTSDRPAALLYGLVAGGAMGNVLDRIFRAKDGLLSGEVVDFIDFQWWPIFNIADMAVIGGAFALAAQVWRLDRMAPSDD